MLFILQASSLQVRSDDDQTTRRKANSSIDMSERAIVAWLPIIIGSEGREVEKQGLTINGKCLSGHDLLSCSIAFVVGSTFEWGRLVGCVCARFMLPRLSGEGMAGLYIY